MHGLRPHAPRYRTVCDAPPTADAPHRGERGARAARARFGRRQRRRPRRTTPIPGAGVRRTQHERGRQHRGVLRRDAGRLAPDPHGRPLRDLRRSAHELPERASRSASATSTWARRTATPSRPAATVATRVRRRHGRQRRRRCSRSASPSNFPASFPRGSSTRPRSPRMWAPGTPGAGSLAGARWLTGFISEVLLQGDVKRLRATRTARAGTFDARVMLCAAGRRREPLQGRLRQPAARPRGRALRGSGRLLGRVVRDPRERRASSPASAPTRSTRWVHARTPEADFDFSAPQPRAGDAVRADLDVTPSRGRRLLHDFDWDLDNDDEFDDRSGQQIKLTFPAGRGGRRARGVQPGGDTASIYYPFDVLPDASAPAGTGGPPSRRTAGADRGRQARRPARDYLSPPGARRSAPGRFTIRVRFARRRPAAPP